MAPSVPNTPKKKLTWWKGKLVVEEVLASGRAPRPRPTWLLPARCVGKDGSSSTRRNPSGTPLPRMSAKPVVIDVDALSPKAKKN